MGKVKAAVGGYTAYKLGKKAHEHHEKKHEEEIVHTPEKKHEHSSDEEHHHFTSHIPGSDWTIPISSFVMAQATQTAQTHPSWPPTDIIIQGHDALAQYYRENVPELVPQSDISEREAEMLRWTAGEYIVERKSNRVSCEEYTRCLVKRMMFYKHAAIFMLTSYQRHQQIINSAKLLDEKAKREGIESIAPLYGLPIPAKGTKATLDFESCCGSTPLANYVAVRDCEMVKLIRNANGIIMGKTNVPEFAASWVTMNPTNGRVLNPYLPTLTSGGSSGGSGAAVGFNIAPVATTEDTGGSTRHPAFQNQVYGYDPTRNHYPNQGNPGFSFYNDQVGLNARSFDDILLVDRIILGTSGAHEAAKAKVEALSNADMKVGLPLFPWVEFDLPEDAYNAHNLRNMKVSDNLREKYEIAKQTLSANEVTLCNDEFPMVYSKWFKREVNSLIDTLWGNRRINGKDFDGIGFPAFHSFTGQMAEWIHEYLDAPVSNKEVFDSAGIAGRGHNPISFFSTSKISDESQFRYSASCQREKTEVWNSYFDAYGVQVIMSPPQFFDAVDYEHIANATLPLWVKQSDGNYELMDGDIAEGHKVSYLILKDIPIPKVIVPTGLDPQGRPTAVAFWGKSVPLDKLYDDEYARVHDLEFLYIVQRLIRVLHSNPLLHRADSPLAP